MTDPEFQDQPDDDGLMGEATVWFGRMCGPEAGMHKPDFDAWLARGALHRAFYNRAGEIYAMGKFLKEERNGRIASRVFRWVRRRPVLATLMVGAIALSGLSAIWTYGPWHGAQRDTATAGEMIRLATREGQVLTQALPDGSKITLQPQSMLVVRYTAARRTFRLEQGQSRFEVAHESRPFVVLAARGSITARGTIFEVAMNPQKHVTVRLLQGKIDVAIPSANKTPSVRRMRTGETISYDGAVGQQAASTSAAKHSKQPAEGVATPDIREFTAAPIGDILSFVNRRGASIRLMDSEVTDLKVSGRFRFDDPEKLAAKLAYLFDLSVDHAPDGEILLRRRNK
jgi:transmembrane sensor